MPREVALSSGRMHVRVPMSDVAVSSMGSSLEGGGIIPACWYDGLWGFSETCNQGLVVGGTSSHFPLMSSMWGGAPCSLVGAPVLPVCLEATLCSCSCVFLPGGISTAA